MTCPVPRQGAHGIGAAGWTSSESAIGQLTLDHMDRRSVRPSFVCRRRRLSILAVPRTSHDEADAHDSSDQGPLCIRVL
jgi:hypothetical protein